MKYHLLLQEDNDEELKFSEIAVIEADGPMPGLLVRLKTLLGALVTKTVSEYKPSDDIQARQVFGVRVGRQGRALRITGFDNPALAPPGLKVGSIVDSSRKLSYMLGYSYNMVNQLAAKARTQRELTMARVNRASDRTNLLTKPLMLHCRGVHFCFDDEIPREVT